MTAARLRLLRKMEMRVKGGTIVSLDQLAALLPGDHGPCMLLAVSKINNARSLQEAKKSPVPPGAEAYLLAVEELRKAAIPIDKKWQACRRKARLYRMSLADQIKWNQAARKVQDEDAQLAVADRRQLWQHKSDACPPPEGLGVPEYLWKKMTLCYQANDACGKPSLQKLVAAEVTWWINESIREYERRLLKAPISPVMSNCRALVVVSSSAEGK